MKFKLNTLINKALLAICIALLPPLLAFLFSYRTSEKHLREQLLKDLSVIADAYESQIYLFLEGIKGRTMDFASDGYIRDRIEAGRGNRTDRIALSDHLARNKKPLVQTLRDIFVTDSEGVVVGATDRTFLGQSLAVKEEFIAGRKTTAVTESGQWILVSTPVKSRTAERTIGVLINRFSVKDLESIMASMVLKEQGTLTGSTDRPTWNAGRPKTLETYLVNRDRFMITQSIFKTDAPFRQRVDTLPVARCIAEGGEMSGFYRDYRGEEVAGASMCIPQLSWTLLVEADAEEVYVPPLRTMRRNTLVTTAAVFGVLGGLFFLFSRTIVDPLRKMAAGAGRIAAGEQGVSIPVLSKDEVGSLAAAFNDMAEQIASRTDQLRASEEKYRTILDSIDEIIYRLRIDDGKLEQQLEFVSAQAARITGYAPEEFLRDPGLWFRIVHPDDLPALARTTEEIIRSAVTGTRIYRMRRKNEDRYIWIEDKMVPQIAPDGRVTGCWGVARDITEQRSAEEQLRVKDHAMESSINAIALMDLGGELTYVNHSFLRMWKYGSESEVLGRPAFDLWKDKERAQEILKSLLSRGQWRGELPGVRSDGSTFDAQVAANVVEAAGGRPGHLMASFLDITERKQTERALAVNAARLAEAQRIARLGTWEWNITTNDLWWSDQIYHIFGLRPREFPATYQAFLDRVHPDDRDVIRTAVDAALTRDMAYDIDHRIVLPDGRVRHVHEQGTVHRDRSGKPVRMTGTVQDITTRKRMEDSVRESEQRFRGIFNSVYDGILVADVETRRFLLANSRICAMLGYTLTELAELGVQDIHFAEDLPVLVGQFERMARGEMNLARDVRVKRKDGTIFVADVAGTPVNLEGRPYLIGIFRDTTEQKKTEAELRKLSAAIEHSVNVVFITDRTGRIEYLNPTFERVTGWPRDEAIGKNPSILASGDKTREEYDGLWKMIMAGKTWRGEYRNKRKDGSLYWASSVITPIMNERGEITHFLAVQEDITERKTAEERLTYLAAYDELTGLLNRARFMELIETWLHAYEMTGFGAGMLLLVDIDEFKYVNDTYGHMTGDEIIKQVGALFKRLIEDLGKQAAAGLADALLCRMGGDEFALFLPNAGVPEGMAIAERLRQAAEEFRPLEGTVRLTVSIGAVAHPEHGRTVKDLMTKVDAALYRTKRTAKNRAYLYRPEDQDLEHIHTRLHQKERILKAMAEDRLLPWFQPLHDLATGTVHHYEALARMRSEDGAILTPGDFIETAEMFGLIGAIDRIITRKTMGVQAEAGRRGVVLSFSMNLSGKELGDEELLSFLKQAIVETGADPAHLVFEITETAAVHDLERAKRFVQSLKEMGCRFSLDDFGVGFTSFVYLRELGVDYIKIDGSFIRSLRTSRNDRLFVKAITDVARGMGIKTVAEFVEDEETLSYLRECGVDFAQGYLIGRPAPDLLP